MQDNFIIKDSRIDVILDEQMFSKNAIVKCLYWYSKDYNVNYSLSDGKYLISLESKSNEPISIDFKNKLNQELVDFNLRDIVTNETKNIRELIIAKAFSNGEYDEEPIGEMEDPLGVKFI